MRTVSYLHAMIFNTGLAEWRIALFGSSQWGKGASDLQCKCLREFLKLAIYYSYLIILDYIKPSLCMVYTTLVALQYGQYEHARSWELRNLVRRKGLKVAERKLSTFASLKRISLYHLIYLYLYTLGVFKKMWFFNLCLDSWVDKQFQYAFKCLWFIYRAYLLWKGQEESKYF